MSKVVSVRMGLAQLAKVDDYAKANGTTRNEAILIAVRSVCGDGGDGDEVEPLADLEPVTSSVSPEAKAARTIKRQERKRARQVEVIAAMPEQVPARLLEKLATRPTDHHPSCPCVRCRKTKE